ncbi:quercetin dioxygenase-like cupin family protein [Mucilaginibacter frigoritolerans]|jgi:quercetin dioxygenase-like cupin family protein|uniref:Quercetin dioxygenase-like cupin family protein n=1 Tax=Mucilaginibacter frigoritolerans TaxID=652788 RepID=A0A562U5R0_9SPHI|nr:cupin domain-containing protein [Mucilaginibacter frigoritolerans]TWJ00725.1 quercetin dioxygenase-like cupin family protein [Mucilaginibacter frigoritolerans]
MKLKHTKTLSIILLMILSAIKVWAQQPVRLSSAGKIMDITILKKLINEPGINNKEVRIEVVSFPPGSTSPPHMHPCPTFGYVLEGEIESVFEGQKHIYKQGDSFYEKSFGLHSVTHNNNLSKQAKLLVFFIADPNQSTSVPPKNSSKVDR